MKKLNLTNKIYVAILALLIVATGIKIYKYKSWERYYYSASISAPPTYPIYVRDSHFILSDNDIGSISTNEANDNSTDWGDSDYNSPTTKELLPVKLVLQYAGYRNQAFYADTITLPVQIIKNAFDNIGNDGVETRLYSGGTVRYLKFVIGVANNGNVIVWLRGQNKETVLLKHHINPHEPVGDETYHDSRLPKKEYLKKVFYIDSARQADFDKGIDKNANYIDTPSRFVTRQQQK